VSQAGYRPRRQVARGLLAALATILLIAPAAATARKPIISYVEGGQLKLYDAETGKDLAPLPIAVANANQFRHGISQSGRYVVFTDAAKKLHLLDRAKKAEVPLPGVDTSNNPHFLSVSNGGVLTFDDNGNGPAGVYDSEAKSFVTTGFPANNDHRQTQINGGGLLLATTCMGPDCVVDLGADSNPFVQNLATRTDLGIPDDDNEDEEHPCISGSGAFVGWDKGNPMQRDVFLYERAKGTFVPLPGLNDGAFDDTFCVLDVGADYIGFQHHNDVEMKLYERSRGALIPLPAKIGAPNNVNGNSRFSVPRCSREFANVIGTERKDVLKGTKAADVFLGLEGKDKLIGRGGNDVICGGDGRDRLVGGKGRDRLLGEKGNDTLRGGASRDVLKGGKGRDDEQQ